MLKLTHLRLFGCVLLSGWSIFAAAGGGDDSAEQLTSKANELISQGKSQEAVQLLDKAITADKSFAFAYYVRGRERFRLGQVERSLEDFDEFVRLEPSRESRQWERGIAMYYAGQFSRGSKQFEMYQTFEGNDVENAVWRYLCVAKMDGRDQAAKTLLPIENDRRIPMMQVYQMFRGNLKPDEVLLAAKQDNPPPDVLDARLFYAHLYLALYFDAGGEQEEAKKYIQLAADEKLKSNRRLNTYMWDVARVHLERLKTKSAKQTPK